MKGFERDIDFSAGERGKFYKRDAIFRKVAMVQVNVELPDTMASVLQCSPDQFSQELRLAAAAQWYQQGRISQEWAAHIAGMDRTDFLLALARMGNDSFVVNFDDLDREIDRD